MAPFFCFETDIRFGFVCVVIYYLRPILKRLKKGKKRPKESSQNDLVSQKKYIFFNVLLCVKHVWCRFGIVGGCEM